MKDAVLLAISLTLLVWLVWRVYRRLARVTRLQKLRDRECYRVSTGEITNAEFQRNIEKINRGEQP